MPGNSFPALNANSVRLVSSAPSAQHTAIDFFSSRRTTGGWLNLGFFEEGGGKGTGGVFSVDCCSSISSERSSSRLLFQFV